MESTHGRDDYSKRDGGKNSNEIIIDFYPDHFYALKREYYVVNVEVSEAVCEELKVKVLIPYKCG